MVGQFWEAHGTVMSCDSVQGYLAPPLHCWGIVWADLRHLTRLRLLDFVIQVHRIWVTALLSAQRPCSLCFSFLCRRVPRWSIMKRLTTAHLPPTLVYSGWGHALSMTELGLFICSYHSSVRLFFLGGGCLQALLSISCHPSIKSGIPNFVNDPWTLISFIVLAHVPPHITHISWKEPPWKRLLYVFPWHAFAPVLPEPTLYHWLELPCQEDQTATLLNLMLEIQLAAQLGVSSVCALRPSLKYFPHLFKNRIPHLPVSYTN